VTDRGPSPPPGSPGSPDADAGADEALRARFRQQVSRYCPSWLRDNVDDIVQDAWMRLKDAQKSNERNLDPGSSLIARVAYCATVDEIRRRRRRREVPVDEAREIVAIHEVPPDRAAGAREVGQAIRDCVEKLLPNRRLAVTLYLQGHTAPRTGTILGWSPKRAENMIFRGMADLRRCLARKGVTP
jgi:RNA polymerase sigma-70 factor (ECF subfamily)